MNNLIYSILLILICAPLSAKRLTLEVVATTGQTFSLNTDTDTDTVEWISFDVQTGAKTIDLQWETSEEPDNAGFLVERFATGQGWSVIAQVDSRTGYDQRYDFTDYSPITGFSCYRIRQTDSDGQVSYSPIETLNFFPIDPVEVSPNPVTDKVSVQLPKGAAILELLTSSGQKTGIPFHGQNGQLQANLSALPSGVYFLCVQLADGQLMTNRILIP